jgi:hypothetical protein
MVGLPALFVHFYSKAYNKEKAAAPRMEDADSSDGDNDSTTTTPPPLRLS